MTFEFIDEQLIHQRTKKLYREVICLEKNDGVQIKVNGRTYINFSSNDYLGLNGHEKISAAHVEGLNRFGTSASASSLITGHHYAHQALEDTVCDWLNKPRCLLFNSGFAANVGTLSALAKDQTDIYIDKLSHASIIDGTYGYSKHCKRFNHNDIDHLKTLLNKKEAPERSKLIVTEGVFSMDGDVAPIKNLREISSSQNAWLYSDDAHSIGVIGEQGQGSSSVGDIDITMATFGKALATSGAFIACENNVAEYLTNFSRHFIYSTAISPAMAWATKTSIELAKKEQWRRDKIFHLSNIFQETLDDQIKVIESDSSIIAITIGNEEQTLAVSKILKEQGMWVTAIRPPTVPKNGSRLRVTITANHNENQIKALANCINKVMN